MRAQRLGGMKVQVEREYGGPDGMKVQVEGESMRDQRLGWDEGTSGESMRAQRLGWDEGTSGGREYEGPEVGWDGVQVRGTSGVGERV